MKKFIQILVSFLAGIGIGTLIEMSITLVTGKYYIAIPSFLANHDILYVKVIQTLLYGGFGLVGQIGSYLYDNEKFSILAATSLHLAMYVLYFSVVGIYLQWFSISKLIFAIILFVVIYFAIWTYRYYIEKSKIDSLNKKLKNK